MIMTAIAMGVIGEAVSQFTKVWDIKPFNCGLCMTFWLSSALMLFTLTPLMGSITFIGFAILTRQIVWKLF